MRKIALMTVFLLALVTTASGALAQEIFRGELKLNGPANKVSALQNVEIPEVVPVEVTLTESEIGMLVQISSDVPFLNRTVDLERSFSFGIFSGDADLFLTGFPLECGEMKTSMYLETNFNAVARTILLEIDDNVDCDELKTSLSYDYIGQKLRAPKSEDNGKKKKKKNKKKNKKKKSNKKGKKKKNKK